MKENTLNRRIYSGYFKRSTLFIKTILSNTFLRAALFGLFFPFILPYVLYLILEPLGFNSKLIALIPISIGIYFTSLLQKVGLIPSSYGHAGIGVIVALGFLFTMLFYFLLYLVVHYWYNKKTRLYFMVFFILVLIGLIYVFAPLYKSELQYAKDKAKSELPYKKDTEKVRQEYNERLIRNQERIQEAINTHNLSICHEIESFVSYDWGLRVVENRESCIKKVKDVLGSGG